MKHQKIAAIDVGSNSIHIIVATFENNNLIVHYRARTPLKLREKISRNGNIDSDSIDAAVVVIDEYVKKSVEFDAKIIAVGTAVLRQAKNSKELIEKVFKKSGVTIRILSGIEEGKLIYEGVKKVISFSENNYLILDIGGGSTELIIANKDGVQFVNSIDIGCISLTMRFFKNNSSFQEQINLSKNYTKDVMKTVIESIKKLNIKSIIGTSGTINSILSLSLKKTILFEEEKNLISINCSSIFETIELILNYNNFDELSNIPFIDKSRIELLPAGAIILNEVLQNFSCEYLNISAYSIKEGIIFNFI